MTRRLVYRPAAVADLDDVFDYIARDSPRRAATFVGELRAQCRKLAELPGLLGRNRPELQAGLRSFAYKDYIILFRYEPGVFEVVNVIDRRASRFRRHDVGVTAKSQVRHWPRPFQAACPVM